MGNLITKWRPLRGGQSERRKAYGGAGNSVHDKSRECRLQALIECLEASGALLPGQFQKALRVTIGHAMAAVPRWRRVDSEAR